jgi:hypothetical protein
VDENSLVQGNKDLSDCVNLFLSTNYLKRPTKEVLPNGKEEYNLPPCTCLFVPAFFIK